ncbi:MAG: UDP-N-acetylmuramoyl-L-alanine--D-glutamate ligase [Ruminococcaceae bacterium]|nr:UDP-N-acetylmuramoyl-L-alanine--D-glutamate ligase [Oscillospiraceae bacterium]
MELRTYFDRLKDKEVLVLGLGVSNRPLVRLLLRHGISVTGCDRTEHEKLDAEVLDLERMGCKLHLGEDYLENISADVAFRTPGLHPDKPELVALKNAGCHMTSEMEAFFEVCPCKIIAVTGSDGKTTTTTLISEMLKKAGHRVWLGGNIGTPLLDRADEMRPEDKVVLELSSFQLMDLGYSAHIAVVTNLAPNHLDVHRDMQEYVEAKTHIFDKQSPEDILIVNHDNAITKGFAPLAKGQLKRFSRQESAEVCLQDGVIYRRGMPVLDQKDILLPGIHNVENYMAAILAVEGMVSDEDIVHVAKHFGGVEHRIELVRVKDGVRYYNDSIASSPSRTIAGLRSFAEKVILIAGGYDKCIPFDDLGVEISKSAKLLICTGATGEKIAQATEKTGNSPEILRIEDFYEAIRTASSRASEGDVVILSPAGPAFDKFKNFMVRGAEFKKTVMEL